MKTGFWVLEDDKGVRLWVEVVRDGVVYMSYRPGDPIAVQSDISDFRLFFTRMRQ